MKGTSAGQRIDVSGYLGAGSLRPIANDSVNTGDYRCVDARDGQRVYDRFVILTESESVYRL